MERNISAEFILILNKIKKIQVSILFKSDSTKWLLKGDVLIHDFCRGSFQIRWDFKVDFGPPLDGKHEKLSRENNSFETS